MTADRPAGVPPLGRVSSPHLADARQSTPPDTPYLQFSYRAKPRTQGSAALYVDRYGQPRMLKSDGEREHRKALTELAWAEARRQKVRTPMVGAVRVHAVFTFARPAAHAKNPPALHTYRPDVDKLSRLLLDALTNAGIFRDDAQVAALHASKEWGTRDATTVTVAAMEGNE